MSGSKWKEGLNMRYASLYIFYFVYFIMTGMSTFLPKFYGEIGMTNAQIGVLGSIPTIVALAITPLLGTLTDRIPKKRYLLTVLLILMACTCFVIPYSTGFLMLLAAVSGYSVFGNNILPLMNTISLEYTSQIGKPFGPIRLLGTLGYQLGALLVGIILSNSLQSLYPMMGVVILLSCTATFIMPDVKGHQHKSEKVPLTKLFADRHLRMLYIMIFFATISSQFYQAFYSKHLGDLGMSNATTSWITLLAVILELPFLYFGDRLYRKTNIWNWMLIGMFFNGVRWIGLALSKTALMNILFQLPGVTILACFEFFPALYLNKHVSAELSGGAQSMLALVSFGAAKIVGSLIGGQICQYTGIPAMFAFLGVWMLFGGVIFWRPARKLAREENH